MFPLESPAARNMLCRGEEYPQDMDGVCSLDSHDAVENVVISIYLHRFTPQAVA